MIIDKESCCGCRVCKEVCPTGAIEMAADEEGFVYPWIDQGKCVQCGLCEKVCPMKNKEGSQR